QANMSARDLTGLCLFDEKGVTLVKPARTRRHLVQLFNQLADAAGLAPASGSVNIDVLMPLAYSFAQEVYPEQLAQGVNKVPWWLPLLPRGPEPTYQIKTKNSGWTVPWWLAMLMPGLGQRVTPRTPVTWMYRLLMLP